VNLIRIFLNETDAPKGKIAFYSILAGLSNVLLLAILNTSAEHASNSEFRLMGVVFFALCLLIYILSQKYVWGIGTKLGEGLIESIRIRIFNKISGCNFENLEKIGQAELYTAINQHTYTLSLSSLPIIVSLQSLVIITFTTLYLAYLSLPAFGLTLIFISIAAWMSYKRSQKTNKVLDLAIASEQNVYYSLSDLLEGFKEIKLNHDREQDLLHTAGVLAGRAKDNRIRANLDMAINFITIQSSFYFLIAVLVFLVPQLSIATYPDTVIKIVTAGLFLMGPVSNVFAWMPTFTNAEKSLSLIFKTEALLDKHQELLKKDCALFPSFEKLSLQKIRHQYRDEFDAINFSTGPIDLQVRHNEILFLTGGNGSGKSTLIKLLLGLYQPCDGQIRLNGTMISAANIFAYRNMFTAILADYHLFSRTYGIREIDQQRVDDLLKRMGLKEKTGLINGEFDTLNLSTGQKKRLALIISILEDRPVMVFDEWAADQDPQFRKIFYHEILPELKANGKTIIAVTHDEKYFDCCDRHFHMEEGLISEVTHSRTK